MSPSPHDRPIRPNPSPPPARTSRSTSPRAHGSCGLGAIKEERMDALLILGGLLLIIAGLVWMIMLAFGTSLLWGFGSLLPPLTLIYPLRHWRTARKAVFLS